MGHRRFPKYSYPTRKSLSDNAPTNKSFDVRTKQQLCYERCSLNFTLHMVISPRVNSDVEWLPFVTKTFI